MLVLAVYNYNTIDCSEDKKGGNHEQHREKRNIGCYWKIGWKI